VEPFWTAYLELRRNRSTADAFAGMINKQSNSCANARYGDLSDVAALVPRQNLGTVASKSNEVDAIGITTVPHRVGHRIARRQFIKSKIVGKRRGRKRDKTIRFKTVRISSWLTMER
jgi:hypothetical protein